MSQWGCSVLHAVFGCQSWSSGLGVSGGNCSLSLPSCSYSFTLFDTCVHWMFWDKYMYCYTNINYWSLIYRHPTFHQQALDGEDKTPHQAETLELSPTITPLHGWRHLKSPWTTGSVTSFWTLNSDSGSEFFCPGPVSTQQQPSMSSTCRNMMSFLQQTKG